MAILISCQGLTKAYGSRPVFDGLSLGIAEGDHAGIVGANGSGKSTLLKLLAGLEDPDGGQVSPRRGLRLAYLAQADRLPGGRTVEQTLADALQDLPLDDRERGERVEASLASTGFPDPHQLVETLSGGWRKRLALARELVREPDLLLLDEPTNHLDLEGVLWLERTLREARFAYVLVTHDRALLQNATNRVIELSRAYADGYLSVNGPYSELLARREEYLAAQAHQQDALETRVRREVEWLRQNAQARSTKQYARIKEAGRLIEDLSQVRSRNAEGKTAGIEFQASGRQTRRLLVGEGVGKTLGGRPLFSGLDLVLSPGRKLGILGANGSGKTTLLRLLAGELDPDAGTLTRADGLRTVYFDQNRERLDPRMPLRQALSPAGDTVVYRDRPLHVIAWAKRFLFREEQLGTPLEQLSGGEQARVLIARLMLQPADLLILDEPTNDLDLQTLDVLEESLESFPGAVVLVTHDRYLLDQVCTEVLALDGRGGHGFFADYTQWERTLRERRPPAPAKPAAPPPAPAAGRITLPELRELSRLEGQIEAAEAEVARLEARLAEPAVASDHLKLQECWQAIEAARAQVAALYARWEELELKHSG